MPSSEVCPGLSNSLRHSLFCIAVDFPHGYVHKFVGTSDKFQENPEIKLVSAASPQEVASAKAPQLLKGQALQQPVVAQLGRGLSFAPASQQVRFGDSPQDVCSALGSPTSTVQKPADPALRHKQQKPALALDYFYTYTDR